MSTYKAWGLNYVTFCAVSVLPDYLQIIVACTDICDNFDGCILRCASALSGIFCFGRICLALCKLVTSLVLSLISLARQKILVGFERYFDWRLCETVSRNAFFDFVLVNDGWVWASRFYVKRSQPTVHQFTVRTYSGLHSICVWYCSERLPVDKCILSRRRETWWNVVTIRTCQS